MKVLYRSFGYFGLIILFFTASCAKYATYTKDVKYMPIHFKPLERKDFTLVGNLENDITLTGKYSKKGGIKLDKKFRDHYEKGLLTRSEATEIMYAAPQPGESITGSLYDNEVFNAVYSPSVPTRTGKKVKPADAAMDFAYYALVEKYVNVDYFINVRFDRKTVIKGKKVTQTVVVKADGVKLKTN